MESMESVFFLDFKVNGRVRKKIIYVKKKKKKCRFLIIRSN